MTRRHSGSIEKPLSIKENVIWNTVGSLFYQGCIWLITVLVVVISKGYEASGILAYAMAIGNIYSPIAQFGTRTFQVSDVNNEFSVHNYSGFRILTSIISLLVCLIYLVLTTSNASLIAPSLVFLLFKLDESICTLFYSTEQKGGRMDYIGQSQIIRGLLCLASFSLTLTMFNSVTSALTSMLISSGITTLLFDYPRASHFGNFAPMIDMRTIKKLVKACTPAVLASFFMSSIVSIARQQFGMIGGEESLGIYASVATPSVLIQALAQYIYSPFIEPFSRKIGCNRVRDSLVFFVKVLTLLFAILLLAEGMLYCAGKPLLLFIYGGTIAPYIDLLPLVLLSTLLIGIEYYLVDALVVMRKQNLAALSCFLSFALSLLLNRPLIEQFGMNGISLSISISFCLSLAMSCAFIVITMAKVVMGKTEEKTLRPTRKQA